jgi:hypothetical protein
MTGIHWIDASTAGGLAIMARPRAGDWLDAEIAQWKEAGVEVVVSLLECSGQLLLALCTEQTFVLRLQSKRPPTL